MRGAPGCYYHLRPPKIDDRLTISGLAISAIPERARTISAICNALFANKIDPKRASALLYALQVTQRDTAISLNRLPKPERQ